MRGPVSDDTDDANDGRRTEPSSLLELFPRLFEDVRNLVEAEVRVYRAEALRGGLSAGKALALVVGAVTLAQGALVASLVGLVLILTPFVGAGWATTIVTVTALCLAALLGWLGWRRFSTILDPDKAS